MQLRNSIVSPNEDSVPIIIDNELQNELINNAEFFKYNVEIPMIANIVGPTYDVVTYFEHEDGKRYSVIHSIFAEDYKKEFETKIKTCEWQVSVCDSKYKRDCIKTYIKDNNCDEQIVYMLSI